MAILSTRSVLLQALLSGDGYGLQLQKRIHASTSGAINLTPGTLYPALARLEVEGLAVACGEGSDKPRGTYSLTNAGRAEAQRERAALRGLLK